MGSRIAPDVGIHCPVVCRVIAADRHGIVDADAAEDVDQGLAEGDVTDVENDECAQYDLRQQVEPCLLVPDLDPGPEEGKGENCPDGLADVNHRGCDGTLH